MLITSFIIQTICNVCDIYYRPYWRCYYSNTDAIIYVVDSMDRERIGISKQELIAMLEVKHVTDALKKMLSTVYLLQAKKIEASFLLKNKTPYAIKLSKNRMLVISEPTTSTCLSLAWSSLMISHHITKSLSLSFASQRITQIFPCPIFMTNAFLVWQLNGNKITIFVALADDNFLLG